MLVAISGNYRTLLIELMLYEKMNTVFIMQDAEGNDICERMIKLGYKCFCYHRKRCNKPIIELASYYKQEYELRRFLKNEGLLEAVDGVRGSDHIYSIFRYFIKCNDIEVIEEGFSNYTEKSQLYKESKIGSLRFMVYRLLLGQVSLMNYKPYGYDERVKKIHLTGIRDIPPELVHKVHLINLYNLWRETKNNDINQIFDFSQKLYENKTIILTQPLSEDGACSEERKIEIYKEIISRIDGDVVIKKHPRDLTDYKKDISNCHVSNEIYPFELLLVNHITPKAVVTITSTVAYDCVSLCDVYILGTREYADLQDRLGVHEPKCLKKGAIMNSNQSC